MVDERSMPKKRKGLRRHLLRLVLIALTVYLTVCLAVFAFQDRLIYFPARGYFADPSDVGLSFESLTLTTADGVSIAAWHVPHPDATATVLFCHGNAGNIADRLHDLKLLHELRLGVLMFDYRGYGDSNGTPSELGTYRDAEAAWAYLVDVKSVSSEKIVLLGRSLGGAVAIELASRHSPGALVVESTFTRLTDVGREHYPLLPVGWLVRHHYDSAAKVGTLRCPKLFLHGRDDTLIPIAQARALHAAAADPKQFIETPGGHDNAGYSYSPTETAILAAFLAEHL